jgi:hypothetical protein
MGREPPQYIFDLREEGVGERARFGVDVEHKGAQGETKGGASLLVPDVKVDKGVGVRSDIPPPRPITRDQLERVTPAGLGRIQTHGLLSQRLDETGRGVKGPGVAHRGGGGASVAPDERVVGAPHGETNIFVATPVRESVSEIDAREVPVAVDGLVPSHGEVGLGQQRRVGEVGHGSGEGYDGGERETDEILDRDRHHYSDEWVFGWVFSRFFGEKRQTTIYWRSYLLGETIYYETRERE